MKRTSPDSDDLDTRLARTYAHSDGKQQHYDEWAEDYDQDLVHDLDYVAPRRVGELFMERVQEREARIVDVACGTGLVGEVLYQSGYASIDGIDFSDGMLERARERGVYRQLQQHDFTQALTPEPLYDALICVGLFAFGRPGMGDLHHVVNCVKPGGTCVVTVNGAAWEKLELASALDDACRRHGYSIERIVRTDYIRAEDIDARVLILTR